MYFDFVERVWYGSGLTPDLERTFYRVVESYWTYDTRSFDEVGYDLVRGDPEVGTQCGLEQEEKMKSSLTPEIFSPAQIEFLRRLGVRVEYLGSNQSVFNDRADRAEGRIRALRCSMADALSCDDRYAEQAK